MSIIFRMSPRGKDRFINMASPRMKRIVRDMFDVWTESVARKRVAEMVERGYVGNDWHDDVVLGTERIVMSEFKPVMTSLVGMAGHEATSRLNREMQKDYPLTFESKQMAFNTATQRVIDWLENIALYYVQDMAPGQLAAIREAMIEMAKGGESLSSIYQRVRDQICLDWRQVKTLERFRLGLIEAGVDKQQLARKVNLRAMKMRRARIERITRTETGRAYSEGYRETIKQAQDAGIIEKAEKRRETAGDDRVRPKHIDDANAGWIGIDEPYPATGEMSAGDSSINCRCVDEYRLD